MPKNKKCAKYFKLYIFEKPLSRQIQIYKNICKISKPENVQNLFKVICAKIYAKFFAKIVLLPFLQGFPRSYKKGNIKLLEVGLNIDLVE